MNRKKILIVLGTRPEIIKLAPILFEFRRNKHFFNHVIVWSGQHKELAQPFLKLFGLKPQFSLKIMEHDQTSSNIMKAVFSKFDRLLKGEKPDLVMVQGDTTTAAAAALCSYYHKIPVAHIEAGLRSGDFYQPFPEEKNRQIISRVANFHFAPTAEAKKNLLREGIDRKSIFVVGNSVVDSLKWLLKHCPPKRACSGEKLMVVTMHRRESFGKPLINICDAIVKLVKRHKNLKVVLPVHLNPSVRRIVIERLKGVDRISLVNPLDYVSFIHLLVSSYIILTDSGGIQEEAPYLGKPVLILRDMTERPEGVNAGVSLVTGRDSAEIVATVDKLLNCASTYKKMARVKSPFGRGDTSTKVVKILKDRL